jgi:hypothetical protein
MRAETIARALGGLARAAAGWRQGVGLGTSSSLVSADALQSIPALMLHAAIEGARQRAQHLEPILAAMLDCGVEPMLVGQHDKAFRLPRDARPSVVIVGEDTDRGLGPAGFHQPSLRRLFRASGGATVISSAAPGDAYALPTATVVRTRRHTAIVETCVARRPSWIEVITRAVPGLALLISAAKRDAA